PVPSISAGSQWRRVLLASAAVLLVSLGLGLVIRSWRGRSEAARRREQALRQITTGNLPGYLWAEHAFEQILAAYPEDDAALAGRALTRAAAAYEFDEPELEDEARHALEQAQKRAAAARLPAVSAASVYLKLSARNAEAADQEARAAATAFPDEATVAYLV